MHKNTLNMEANKQIGKIKDLGKDGATKADEFSETIQTAFDPPPSFSENFVANFFIMDIVEYIQGGTKAR